MIDWLMVSSMNFNSSGTSMRFLRISVSQLMCFILKRSLLDRVGANSSEVLVNLTVTEFSEPHHRSRQASTSKVPCFPFAVTFIHFQ
jgi:hypothetical protein